MAEPRVVSNKWEIIRIIGHGGMGSVYEVRHTTLEIRRALKTLHRHLADDPDLVRRFLREGRNEARLDHPNIVRVYDFDTDPEFGVYLTMELVEGWDVKQLMQQGAIPFHEVVRIGCEVAAALDYAHCAIPPIVHRDIKPANILISAATGVAKVTDFGIAKELAERETGVTATQGFIGTMRYAAPEQVRDDVKIDARCDLYSLGVMLYEMYSGYIFLDGEKPADIYRRTMIEPDWQPSMVYSSPPPDEFAEVVRWCLQRRREDRVPSARELLKCLQLCVAAGADPGYDQRALGGGVALTAGPDLAARPAPFAETSVTAATVIALGVDEDATTIVGLRAKISRFRQDLNAEAEAFATLCAEAVALGLPLDGLPAPDDLSSQLAELDDEVDAAGDSRDRERLAHAFSRCERVREEFAARTTEVRRRLAVGGDTARAAVTQQAPTVQPSRWLRRLPVAGLVALVAIAAVWQVVSRTTPAPAPLPTTPVEQRAEPNVAPQPPGIEVTHVNRPPVLANLVPDPNTAVASKIGDSVLFKAEATDADKDDQLTYRWTVDGKAAGTNAPQLSVKVASNHAVGVSVSDGKDHADATWRIAAVAPLVFDFSPKQLDTVPFKSTAAFKLIPPSDLSLADVTFTWTLDGRTVSNAPAFTLETSDPAWVRATPLKLTATATDQHRGDFSHVWKVTVVPPAPEIQSATPPADKPIDAESGQSLTFQVAAAPPVGNQKFTYLFARDDQSAARSGQPQFELRVADESEHRVSARVEDNYRQASKQTVTWHIQGSDILSQARKWVVTFQEARQNRDAEKEGQLRDLSVTEVNRLQDAYSKQKDLQVSFTALQIDKLAANRARALFTMTQSFTAPNGERISGRLACELTLTRTDGRLRAERRAQGPCVPVQ